ncbi:MAG: serine/threonine protein kinase, partial [Myxococcota bacterium]
MRDAVGEGAFGVVYAADDLRRKARLAVKVLRSATPWSQVRFKSEFRHLSGVRHPNLVRIYELHAEQEPWFFTMELIDGVSPLRWLDIYGGDDAPTEDTTDQSTMEPAQRVVPTPQVSRPADPVQLRSIFKQIAAGVQALHDLGLLHRDIKPSNVLVEPSGTVKLLDFGLVGVLDEPEAGGARGTPSYIAPELWEGVAASKASDWFSVGVMLHQVLTGGLPGAPTLLSPSDPALWVLCQRLLDSAPDRRPDGEEVLAAMGAVRTPTPRQVFVGRQDELAFLKKAADAVGPRRPVIALLSGTSGVGKSALVDHFLRETRDQETIRLVGRCRQHEALPHKALDGIIDALGRQLLRLPPGLIRPLLPREMGALQQVFPALGVTRTLRTSSAPLPQDPFAVRKQAFQALASLLGAVARRWRLVLVIDDLQWGDAASARVLAEVFSGPDAPGLLMVGTVRTEEEADSPFLNAWQDFCAAAESDGRLVRQTIAPLPREDARELIEHLLETDADTPPDPARIDRIIAESGGSPFFAAELARRTPAGLSMSLSEALSSRLEELGASSRRLLEVIAVSGQSTPLSVLFQASGLTGGWEELDALRTSRLVRLQEHDVATRVESYHDRTTEAVLEMLGEDGTRRCSLSLAETLVEEAPAHTEQIALMFCRAGEPEQGAPYAITAADSAWDSLAFGRAAELYGLAVQGREDATLQRRHADALALAGQGAEAAPRYEVLAQTPEAAPDAQGDLWRLAAEQWLTTGHVDRGTTILKRLLRQTGLSWPVRTPVVLARIGLELLWLRLWGPERMMSRVPARRDPVERKRVELLWTAIRGLSSVDMLRASYFTARAFRSATRVGSTSHSITIGLYLSATLRSMGRPMGDRLRESCVRRITADSDPYLTAARDVTDAWVALNTSQWVEAHRAGTAALERYTAECVGTSWERTVATSYIGASLQYLGRLDEQFDFTADALRQVEGAGDRHGIIVVLLQRSFAWLNRDRPDRSREQCERILTLCEEEIFGWRHLFVQAREGETDLYCCDVVGAWK